MVFYDSSGKKILDTKVDDNSYRYRSLMAKPQLVLKFSLPEYIDIPVGAWCMFQNEKFVLRSASNLKKSGTRNIEYNMTLGQDEDDLGLYKMRNSVDGRLKYSLCAKPHELVEEIVKNLNARAGSDVWSVGTCIEANEKTIEFNHSYIDDALQSVADLFETEWEIVNHVISLHKVEYFKDDPLPLSYGKGNGFVPGVGRTVQSDEMPVKRLYVQGGERNIDRSKYGSATLLLPKGQTLEYEGRTYKTDAQGYYIERVDKVSDAVKEDSLDCSDIYPSRVGKVTGVEIIDKSKNFYDFIDDTIPDDLDFNDYIIAGETATIIFQSGMLAGDGKEFEFKYKHAERRFELVPQEIDGITMPNETFKPEVGNTYAVFGIMLPIDSVYFCNNLTKQGASWDMFREAARKLYECEDQKFTFSGELQGLWAKRNWLNVGGYLKVGAYILFSDEQFAPEGVSIRITGIKDYVNSPYSPQLEISNSVSGKSLSSQLKEIDNQEVVINDTKKGILQFTKRRFRDALETIEMLNDSLLNFSEGINPVAVQTMAALIGDESLQFRFVLSKTILAPVAYNITYDNTTKQLHCPRNGFLQHMTIGINSISSSHKTAEYMVWEMSEYLSPTLTEADSKYYLYARVSRNDTNAKGTFVLSETAIDMDDESGYYHLLVGVLNSESGGERSFVTLYGFTEILPGRITTDTIVSADGKTYFDLLRGEIGGKIYFLDGLVSGIIGVADDERNVNAGLCGSGSAASDVRFWAGSNADNRATAPYRVSHDGKLFSTNAEITGTVFADGRFLGGIGNPYVTLDLEGIIKFLSLEELVKGQNIMAKGGNGDGGVMLPIEIGTETRWDGTEFIIKNIADPFLITCPGNLVSRIKINGRPIYSIRLETDTFVKLKVYQDADTSQGISYEIMNPADFYVKPTGEIGTGTAFTTAVAKGRNYIGNQKLDVTIDGIQNNAKAVYYPDSADTSANWGSFFLSKAVWFNTFLNVRNIDIPCHEYEFGIDDSDKRMLDGFDVDFINITIINVPYTPSVLYPSPVLTLKMHAQQRVLLKVTNPNKPTTLAAIQVYIQGGGLQNITQGKVYEFFKASDSDDHPYCLNAINEQTNTTA